MRIKTVSTRKPGSIRVVALLLVAIAISITVIYNRTPSPTIEVGLNENGIGIVRVPQPDPSHGRIASIASLPSPNALGVIDLTRTDLRKVDLSDKGDLLISQATFDYGTRWPSKLPREFDPKEILEEGKNPGLGVRSLHKKGITGEGVSIGIIDQTLLVDHTEIVDRVKHYEEIEANLTTELHSAVAAIAMGKNVGVAPAANLYYIGTSFGGGRKAENIARALDRLIEINATLPKDEQIRVISISASWLPTDPGYEMADAAAKRAREAGIFVISSVVEEYYDFRYQGLGRTPGNDPDDPKSYEPGFWWAPDYETWYPDGQAHDRLLVPMDSRTVTTWFDRNGYAFDRHAGWSWCAPWIAGLYALAIQANPDITPDTFCEAALETAVYVPLKGGDPGEMLGPIINPVELIERLLTQSALP